jgi:hypothetical protein
MTGSLRMTLILYRVSLRDFFQACAFEFVPFPLQKKPAGQSQRATMQRQPGLSWNRPQTPPSELCAG